MDDSEPSHSRDQGDAEEVQHRFGSSPAVSLGVEEEFMLLDPGSLELVPAYSDVAARAAQLGAEIAPEIVQSVVESRTAPWRTASEVHADLVAQRDLLGQACRDTGYVLAAAGTHPYCWVEAERLTADEHYRKVAADFPWVAQEAMTYGMHVHVGMPSADDAARVATALRELLPLFVALSANSPFWKGAVTGLEATRLPLAGLFPHSGLPPRLECWSDYEQLLAALPGSDGCARSPVDLWWHVRPQPKLGTIEVRIFDTQTEAEEAAALAALLQACALRLLEDAQAFAGELPQPDAVIEENIWSAARSGLDAELIAGGHGRRPARELIDRLLVELSSAFHDLGSHGYTEVLQRMLRGNGADRQLLRHAQSGRFDPVLRELVERTAPARSQRRPAPTVQSAAPPTTTVAHLWPSVHLRV